MNHQRPWPKENDPSLLDVFRIWYTIQGEGPHVGRPAVFVRLSGCNIQCPACDTDYTSKRSPMTPDEIVAAVVRATRHHLGRGLVVLTGGEPLRQDITLLVDNLLREGFEVQIETNGVLYRPLPFRNSRFSVVCSPKTSAINDTLSHHVKAWKYVLDADYVDPEDGLPLRTMRGPGRAARPPQGNIAPIYVQPLDEGLPERNERNLRAAIISCLTHGYRLCLQVHKIVGLE